MPKTSENCPLDLPLCLLQSLVSNGRLGKLIKEQLIRLIEISSKALIEIVDELRECDRSLSRRASPTSLRPFQALA